MTIKAAEDVVEQPVHLTLQRQERVAVVIAGDRRNLVAVVAVPGDQITYAHCLSPFMSSWPAIGKASPGVGRPGDHRRGLLQAACFLASILRCATFGRAAALPIWIRRGFISSGSSRSRSMVRRPFSSPAPVT